MMVLLDIVPECFSNSAVRKVGYLYSLLCYEHSVSLAICDNIKQSRLTRNTLDTTFEISKLIKVSPKHQRIFEKLKAELSPYSPGIHVLCPTRWIARAQSSNSI